MGEQIVNLKMKFLTLVLSVILLTNQIKCSEVAPGNFVTCTICETIMTALDENITDPSNEQAVADFLAQICNYVGPNLESICLEFINEYTDDIIDQLVHNYLQPQQVCASIGACP